MFYVVNEGTECSVWQLTQMILGGQICPIRTCIAYGMSRNGAIQYAQRLARG